jgi:predicted lipid-binding transport protein (Tim44 family)
MLGGLLFGGFGHAGGMGAGGGMGFGLMDLLLLGGIAYLIYYMVRRNRERQATASAYYGGASEEVRESGASTAVLDPPAASQDRDRGIEYIRRMDGSFNPAAFTEWCTDAFFRIQAAWMRRDPEGLRPLLTDEMLRTFREQIEASRRKGETNKLENITVRSVEITEAWQEQGQDYATVRFLANLLDYTVTDATGAVVGGSASEPVKFEEFWTWTRPVGPNPWRLSAIHQAE